MTADAGILSMESSIGRILRLYWSAMAAARMEREEPRDDAADRRDVRLARQGDGDAYARLIDRHQGTIARQMWRFTRDPLEHHELVQDVFVNAWSSLAGYRGEGPFLHWLRKIAVRTGYALWRRRRRRRAEQPLGDVVATMLAEDPADHSAAEAAEMVHCLLARLPPRDRVVLTLLHLEERSVAEIADMLGWSRSMVKVQAWRARGKLKKLFASAGVTE